MADVGEAGVTPLKALLGCGRGPRSSGVASSRILKTPVARPIWAIGRASVGTTAKAPDQPGDELVEADSLTPDHVERVARDPAGRPRDDRAEVRLGKQIVHVDPGEDPVQVHAGH